MYLRRSTRHSQGTTLSVARTRLLPPAPSSYAWKRSKNRGFSGKPCLIVGRGGYVT